MWTARLDATLTCSGFELFYKGLPGFWGEQEKQKRGIHINTTNSQRCLFFQMVFLAVKREIKWAHQFQIVHKCYWCWSRSLDCRITQLYGSRGPLNKRLWWRSTETKCSPDSDRFMELNLTLRSFQWIPGTDSSTSPEPAISPFLKETRQYFLRHSSPAL